MHAKRSDGRRVRRLPPPKRTDDIPHPNYIYLGPCKLQHGNRNVPKLPAEILEIYIEDAIGDYLDRLFLGPGAGPHAGSTAIDRPKIAWNSIKTLLHLDYQHRAVASYILTRLFPSHPLPKPGVLADWKRLSQSMQYLHKCRDIFEFFRDPNPSWFLDPAKARNIRSDNKTYITRRFLQSYLALNVDNYCSPTFYPLLALFGINGPHLIQPTKPGDLEEMFCNKVMWRGVRSHSEILARKIMSSAFAHVQEFMDGQFEFTNDRAKWDDFIQTSNLGLKVLLRLQSDNNENWAKMIHCSPPTDIDEFFNKFCAKHDMTCAISNFAQTCHKLVKFQQTHPEWMTLLGLVDDIQDRCRLKGPRGALREKLIAHYVNGKGPSATGKCTKHMHRDELFVR